MKLNILATSLERLKKNVFRYIEFVEPYPQLLCGLLSSIKLSEVKDEEMFREVCLLAFTSNFIMKNSSFSANVAG